MSRQRGFTIVEAAIGLLLVVLITAALGSTFLVGYTTISKESKQISADAALNDASLYLLRDLSSSTWTFTNGALAPGNGNFIALAYGNPATIITYRLDAQGNLLRAVNLGATGVSARGLQGVALATAGCQLTITLTPRAVPTAQTLRTTERTGAARCF